MKQFVREYANDKKHRIYRLIEEHPHNAVDYINSCIDAYERGYLSTDETMEFIADSIGKAREWSK